MTTELHTLSNGARIVIDPMPHIETAISGFFFGVGARHETARNNGIAHFLEHMAFKGTKTRTVEQLTKEMASFGAGANAATGKERTFYYIDGQARHITRAVNILNDITRHSTLPADELETERGAILQEIDMRDDQPDSLADKQATLLAFPGQPLGASTLGPRTNIETMARTTLNRFMRAHYHAGNLVACVAGNVDADKILDELNQTAGNFPTGKRKKVTKGKYVGGGIHITKPTEQSCISLCFNSGARNNPRLIDESILGMIMGGDMWSRLFVEIREKRGFAYGAGSYNSPYSDTGLFFIEVGTSPDKTEQVLDLIAQEIHKIQNNGVSEEELVFAREAFNTAIAKQQESSAARMRTSAQDIFTYGRLRPVQEKLDLADSVTREDIQKAAQRIFSTTPTLATVGPQERPDYYDHFRSKLGL